VHHLAALGWHRRACGHAGTRRTRLLEPPGGKTAGECAYCCQVAQPLSGSMCETKATEHLPARCAKSIIAETCTAAGPNKWCMLTYNGLLSHSSCKAWRPDNSHLHPIPAIGKANKAASLHLKCGRNVAVKGGLWAKVHFTYKDGGGVAAWPLVQLLPLREVSDAPIVRYWHTLPALYGQSGNCSATSVRVLEAQRARIRMSSHIM
jgi:hypothetical protein